LQVIRLKTDSVKDSDREDGKMNASRTLSVLVTMLIGGCSTPPDLTGTILAADTTGISIQGPYVAPWHDPQKRPNPTIGMRVQAESHCAGARHTSSKAADEQGLFFVYRFDCPPS